MKKFFLTFTILFLVSHSFSNNNFKNPALQFMGLSKQQQLLLTVARTVDTMVYPYCNSAGLTTAFGYINKVVFGSINNTSENNGGYGNFTAISTSVTKGQTYTLNVQAGFKGPGHKESWTIYVDYNADGDFDDDGEKIAFVLTNTTVMASKAFQIPSTAKPGTTRMRIQMRYYPGIPNPCGKFLFGEVEDYNLNILGNSGPGGDPGGDPDGLLPNSLSVSPNPLVSSSLRLNYTLTKGGNISFKVIDANGLAHGNYKAGIQNKGANSYIMNGLSSLRNGYYYVFVEQNGKAIGKITFLVAH